MGAKALRNAQRKLRAILRERDLFLVTVADPNGDVVQRLFAYLPEQPVYLYHGLTRETVAVCPPTVRYGELGDTEVIMEQLTKCGK